MDPDRIEAALAGLGPESRALVELSVIREVADDDIASLLGTEESAVRSRREDALAQLATALGAGSAEEVGALVRDMRELPAVRWRDDGEQDAETSDIRPQTSEAPPAPAPVEPPAPIVEPGAKRRRPLVPLLLGGVLVAVVVLVIALSGGGDDEDPAPADEPASAPASPAGKAAKLKAVAGGRGAGTAEIDNGTLDLSVDGLPDPGDAGYVVWLYNSLGDARPLNRSQSDPKFELKAKLPEGADNYRYVDVSLEPADDNRNHSGQTVLRLPLSSLR